MEKETILYNVASEIDYNVISNVLKNGGTVVFPTETVYGIGANALDSRAIDKIFVAKGRPNDNPLIVHIASMDMLEEIAENVDDVLLKLGDAFWPGPFTMVLKKKDILPDITTGGLDTVAVRIPNHPIALKILQESGLLIAAPSANISGKPSPTKVSHVIEDLNGRVDIIVDGGDTGIGLESTVVDVTGDIVRILRPGAITPDMIEDVTGLKVTQELIETDKPVSPGTRYAHYEPKAEFIVAYGSNEEIVSKICDKAKSFEGQKIGILATEETKDLYNGIDIEQLIVIGSREKPEDIARNFFATLRQMDALGVDVILGEAVEESGIGIAIMNRMIKACARNVM